MSLLIYDYWLFMACKVIMVVIMTALAIYALRQLFGKDL